MDTRQPGGLPVILSALVSPADDVRRFRRYPMTLEAGVRLDAQSVPHQQCQVWHDGDDSCLRLNYRSVLAGNLSLTGLYFISTLPYREGLRLEVRIPLPGQVLNLPAVVCRLDSPARTALGSLETAFGCGVDFRFRETSACSRRALMEFLVRNTLSE